MLGVDGESGERGGGSLFCPTGISALAVYFSHPFIDTELTSQLN